MSRWNSRSRATIAVAVLVGAAMATSGCSDEHQTQPAEVDAADEAPGAQDGSVSEAPDDSLDGGPGADALHQADAMPSDSGRDAGDPCPIVDGGCIEGCVPSHGSPFEVSEQCLGAPQLLVCFDQFETPPAQALPMMAPDQTCWIVYPAAQKLEDLGWVGAEHSSGICDVVTLQSAKPCP